MKASPAARPSLVYQLGLGLVALAMVILPCIYVALTAFAAYGVYYFAMHYFTAIWDWHIGHSYIPLVLKIVCSWTPLLVGSAITFFMVKPLFAGWPHGMQPLALDPQVEPQVYQLVSDICATVGAPFPRRIELDCALNASAHFDRGLRGFFGNHLILTIGLPLVAGLSVRELAGVIAHELGHFRQGAGMRLSYLIRRVNLWFARVIYGRDDWDTLIESWTAEAEGWLAIMGGCVRIGVWLSRRVLWLLMIIGHAISCLLLREMEYDADRAKVRVAGSGALEATMLKLAVLGTVLADVNREMERMWRNHRRLPDNLPVLVEHHATRFPPERLADVESNVGCGKTGLLDTHPSDADRIRHARGLNEPGFDLGDGPARELFENFETLSRLVTLAHYEDDLEVPATPDFLIPVEALIDPASTAAAPMARITYGPSHGLQR